MSRRNAGARRTPARVTTHSISIDELAPGGSGVGHAVVAGERRAIFVAHAAIGDEVEVAVDLASRPARGKVLRVLRAGPGRVTPACDSVERCGACDWMHLSPETQRDARVSQLRAALPASFRDAPLTVHEADDSVAYRTRVRVHVRASGGRAVTGLHAKGTHDVVEVGTCVILHPALDRARAALGPLLDGAHGQGEAQLALGQDGKPVAELRWEGRMPAAVFGRLESAVLAGAFRGFSVHLGDVSRPAVIGDPAPHMKGADGQPLVLAAGGFAQASERSNVLLGQRVAAMARDAALGGPGGTRAVELYAGAGNFTVLLARDFESLLTVESSAPACDAARKNLAARGLRARVTHADVDSFDVPPQTGLVVLDPPRTGARAASLALAASRVKAIVYVSCDTATLSRDLATLAASYTPLAVESFAMFPQTSHAETVISLRRASRDTRGSS
jgi:23S rRNA (uracil1939-C5)-methyltransferase